MQRYIAKIRDASGLIRVSNNTYPNDVAMLKLCQPKAIQFAIIEIEPTHTLTDDDIQTAARNAEWFAVR